LYRNFRSSPPPPHTIFSPFSFHASRDPTKLSLLSTKDGFWGLFPRLGDFSPTFSCSAHSCVNHFLKSGVLLSPVGVGPCPHFWPLLQWFERKFFPVPFFCFSFTCWWFPPALLSARRVRLLCRVWFFSDSGLFSSHFMNSSPQDLDPETNLCPSSPIPPRNHVSVLSSPKFSRTLPFVFFPPLSTHGRGSLCFRQTFPFCRVMCHFA